MFGKFDFDLNVNVENNSKTITTGDIKVSAGDNSTAIGINC